MKNRFIRTERFLLHMQRRYGHEGVRLTEDRLKVFERFRIAVDSAVMIADDVVAELASVAVAHREPVHFDAQNQQGRLVA